MTGQRLLRGAFAAAALVLSFALLAMPAHAVDAARPEVGKPLQAAESLFKARKYNDALAKVAEADAVSAKTPYETYLVQVMRGSIAAAAGQHATAANAFEAAIATGRVSGSERLKLVQAVAGLHYQAKDYAKAAQWAARYQKEGGTDPQARTLLVQSLYLGNDCAAVARLLGDAGEEKSGPRPTEAELQILANCYLRQKDNTGYVSAIERLVLYYPKKEYWTDLLNRVQKRSGFSDRLALDVFRLKLATGNVATANDYLEMAQLALQAGFPFEARAVVDKGYAAGALGTGKDAERHKRLKDLVLRTAAELVKARPQAEKEAETDKSGDALVGIGYNYVTEGAPQKGLAIMERGLQRGKLKRTEDAKLLLGVAQLQSGAKSRALQTLKGVQGKDGTAELAKLWILLGQRS